MSQRESALMSLRKRITNPRDGGLQRRELIGDIRGRWGRDRPRRRASLSSASLRLHKANLRGPQHDRQKGPIGGLKVIQTDTVGAILLRVITAIPIGERADHDNDSGEGAVDERAVVADLLPLAHRLRLADHVLYIDVSQQLPKPALLGLRLRRDVSSRACSSLIRASNWRTGPPVTWGEPPTPAPRLVLRTSPPRIHQSRVAWIPDHAQCTSPRSRFMLA